MQKGGVAKTTNACHLAAALGDAGHRVLLWDVDENYGATKVFGVPNEGFWTTMDLLSEEAAVDDVILAFDDAELDIELPPNVDFIPSSRSLRNVNTILAAKDQFFNPNDVLKPPLEQLKQLGRYEFIIIDTGPHASTTTRSAYMVSDYFVLSLIPEKQAVDSLPDALQDIGNARRPGRNPDLYLLGLIVSCMDRRRTLAKRYEEAIGERFKQANQEPVKFETTVSTAAAIDKAYHQGKTLIQVEPTHKVSEQYRALAREVVQRITRHEAEKAAQRGAQDAVTSAPTPSAPTPSEATRAGVIANA
jgi:chromosome partitioning protein